MTAPADSNPRQHGENHVLTWLLINDCLASAFCSGLGSLSQGALASSEVWLLGPSKTAQKAPSCQPTAWRRLWFRLRHQDCEPPGDHAKPSTTQQLIDVANQRPKRRSFLQWVDAGEKQVAILLTVITAVVIAAAIVQLTIRVALALITTEQDAYWLGDGLIRILGDLLTVLIALEVLQNITSYLRRHVVQIELVLVTALTPWPEKWCSACIL